MQKSLAWHKKAFHLIWRESDGVPKGEAEIITLHLVKEDEVSISLPLPLQKISQTVQCTLEMFDITRQGPKAHE